MSSATVKPSITKTSKQWSAMMQGWYYVGSLMGQRHDRVQTESQIATVDSCFDLVGSLLHGVASCEVFSWSTDIHKPTIGRWWWPQMKLKFWTFPIVPCHAFCMWHWPIGKDLDLSFIWGHHHLHIMGLWISVEQLNTSQFVAAPQFPSHNFVNQCSQFKFAVLDSEKCRDFFENFRHKAVIFNITHNIGVKKKKNGTTANTSNQEHFSREYNVVSPATGGPHNVSG